MPSTLERVLHADPVPERLAAAAAAGAAAQHPASAGASFNEYVEYDAFSSASIDSLKAASVLLTMLPMLIVYPWIQRYFTKGTLCGSDQRMIES